MIRFLNHMRNIQNASIVKSVFCLFVVCILAACANNTAQQTGEYQIYDPFEDANRVTFAVNDAVDQAVAKPVAQAYQFVLPSPARTGIRNVLRNLRTPVNAANQLLQGDIEGMAGDLSRATINTAFGFGGLIDIAEDAGIEYEHEDFGQTLAVWGIGSGPYLVLPILGPSTGRDAIGLAVDSYADPVRLYLFNVDDEEWHYARVGVGAVSKRAELLKALDSLRENSIDYYAALRSAYYQKRMALINDRDPDAPATVIPDYDDEDF